MADAGRPRMDDPIALDLPFSAESAAVARQELLAWMRGLDARDEQREDALRATLLDYCDRMHTNEPVHTWD